MDKRRVEMTRVVRGREKEWAEGRRVRTVRVIIRSFVGRREAVMVHDVEL